VRSSAKAPRIEARIPLDSRPARSSGYACLVKIWSRSLPRTVRRSSPFQRVTMLPGMRRNPDHLALVPGHGACYSFCRDALIRDDRLDGSALCAGYSGSL
jgi:hypothetical protein